MGNGTFCISLDFEKYWGIYDVSRWQDEMERLTNVKEVVFELLKHFEVREIHATWATVGLLHFADWGPLSAAAAGMNISYLNPDLSPYPVDEKFKDVPFPILSGSEEIGKILNTPHQELASHTFSHYYALELGQTEEDFISDLDKMVALSSDLKQNFQSIIFPRNQINETYLQRCAEKGYLAFRGNQESRLWSNSRYQSESLIKRGQRYLDAYYAITETKALKLEELESVGGLVNIPATRFLRPHSGKKILEKSKIKRIKEEMTSAAKNGEIYHLWWHPHNFAVRQEEHFEQLRVILDHFDDLNKTYNFQSLNMKEIASYVK